MRAARMRTFVGALLRHRALVGGMIATLFVAGLFAARGASPGQIHAAQDAAGNPPSITATGYGEARLPADRATVQILLTGSVLGQTPTPSPATAGTPTPTDAEDAEEAEPLELVIAAIAGSGNGVAAGDVRFTVSPVLSGAFVGPEQTDAARLDIEVPRPRLDLLNTLVTRVRETAGANGLMLSQVGVRYQVDDCASLQGDAEAAAIDDARARAQRQAEHLGVQLGEMIAATDGGIASGALFFGADACGPLAPGAGYFGPGIGVTIPAFDPTVPTEAAVYAQISLTFAVTSTAATPTATDPGVVVTIVAPTATAPGTPVAVGFAPTHLVNSGSSIDLRSDPTATSEVLSTLPPAAPLQFLWEQALDESRTLWLRFQTEDGSAGWIRQVDAVPLP